MTVPSAPPAGEPYFDLGSYHRRIDTDSVDAQTWFDRAMVWAYAFDHEEAVACFERALAHDPGLALAHWGIAYAVGPNYNKAWEAFDPVDLRTSLERARTALAAAAALARTDRERALVAALAARFPTAEPEVTLLDTGHGDYADAMVALAAAHPDDVDLAALAADALLNVSAWALWDTSTGRPAPGSRVLEALELLTAALRTPAGRTHPGILHLQVHALEMSAAPQDALPAADLLRTLVPDAAHLLHMPSHVDVLCGDYRSAVQANKAAVAADRRRAAAGEPVGFQWLYRAHDLHFVVYAAMFEGRFGVAWEAARELAAQLTPDVLRTSSPPMADWLEAFAAMPVHVLVRFGRWEELLAEPLPADPALYQSTTATVRYGRALAFAATGDVERARAEREAFTAAHAAVAPTRMLFNNTSHDILRVAAAMLDGEIAYREGRFDEAFAALREAIARDDALPYDEPWGWMQPTRHAHGALLLERGRVEEAARVYAADLGLDPTLPRCVAHPDNVWSLHGYHECLRRLGRDAEAALIEQRLGVALARADVPIRASCACRLDVIDPA